MVCVCVCRGMVCEVCVGWVGVGWRFTVRRTDTDVGLCK